MKNYKIKKPLAVLSDFDGTITTVDTLKFLLDNFGASNWMDIEDKVKDGIMPEREALQAEFSTLNVSWDKAIEAILENIEIDPGFKSFINMVRRADLDFVILSGGVSEIIDPILMREDLDWIEVRANNVEVSGRNWKLIPSNRPRIKLNCNHCKSYSLQEMKNMGIYTIFIGDGLTDRCPAESADLVFAKHELAEFCQLKGIEYIPYNNFAEIETTFIEIIGELSIN